MLMNYQLDRYDTCTVCYVHDYMYMYNLYMYMYVYNYVHVMSICVSSRCVIVVLLFEEILLYFPLFMDYLVR